MPAGLRSPSARGPKSLQIDRLSMGYYDAQSGDADRTAFRKAEKRYKLYKHSSTSARSAKHRVAVPTTDLSDVMDFRKVRDSGETSENVIRLDGEFDWPVFTLQDHPGFYFIPEVLPVDEQMHWIKEALTKFPEPPNRTNHTALHGPIFNLWDGAQNEEAMEEFGDHEGNAHLDQMEGEGPVKFSSEKPLDLASLSTNGEYVADRVSEPSNHKFGGNQQTLQERYLDMKKIALSRRIPMKSLLRKLRWATVGLQFDWSKRAYDLSLPYRPIAPELLKLATALAKPAMKGEDFHAEAAIVNYFKCDDMLGGHLDDMEADWSKPIVSISFGCKAIFLLGGTSRDDNPTAMFLRSGDVVLMAGPARSCYHGVPRIFVDPKESDLPAFDTSDPASVPFIDYMRTSRINLNIRQVF